MKPYVQGNDTARTLILIIVSVLSLSVLFSMKDSWLDFPITPLLWASVAVSASAVGHIVWLVVSIFSEKNRFYSVMPLTCAALTAVSAIQAGIESRSGEMFSDLGAAVIIVLFTLPLAAVTLLWIIVGIRHLIRLVRKKGITK